MDALQQFLIVLATIIFSAGCRTFPHPLPRKAGALGFLVATYLTAWFLTGSHVAGGAALSLWFFLPWVELLTRVRALRLPVEKSLEQKSPPGPSRFPTLEELTADVEDEGFEHVQDAGWDWDGMNQFFRIFYREEDGCQVSICLNEQQQMSMSYLTVTTRDESGQSWRTWNYPFSQTMPAPPNLHLNRVEKANSFRELLLSHDRYLLDHGVTLDHVIRDEPDEIHQLIEQEVRVQVDHSLARGIIALSGKGTFRYSWRGLFYLWAQFIKDMVKMA